jgi:hypothetical protein
MNDDRDIETLLRRYQPAGPPPGLRARIAPPAIATGRTWPWLAAAAALLAATIGLHMSSSRLARQMAPPRPFDEQAAAIADLELSLGGGDEARQLAEQVIQQRDLERTLEAGRMPVGTSGGQR